jgi:hypothetical protein
MDPYTYSPLPTGLHIRLLTINTNSPAFSVTLKAHRLFEAPSYAALSYAWGIPSSTYALLVSAHLLQVQENLYRALQSLHTRRFQVPVWIDALCINQSDGEEKNHQIPLMRNIYSQASTVLVWLGEASKIEEKALRALPTIVAALDRVDPSLALWNAHHNPSERLDILFAELGLPDPKSNIWPTISGLLTRSWFKRLWVLQEVTLARQIEVFCGSATIAWDVLVNLPRVVWKHRLIRLVSHKNSENEDSRGGFDQLQAFELCRNLLSRTPEAGVYIPKLLTMIRGKDVTNPADKVYAVLGLIPKPFQDSIVVNYSRTAAEVYTDFAGRWAPHDIDFSLLSEVSNKKTARMERLPSWCPDFNSPGLQSTLGGESGRRSGYHAGFRKPWEHKHRIINLVNSNTITCSGFVVDRIEAKVEEYRVAFPLTPEGARILLDWEERCLRLARKTYPESSDIPLAYPRTLIAQRILELDGFPRQSKPDCTEVYKEWKLVLQAMAQTGHGFRVSTNCFYYTNTMGNIQLGRAFFSTSAGRIGLGPSDIEPGDFVWIFENSFVPCILRYRAPGMPNVFVGDGYVDGLMYNEALDFLDMWSIKPVQLLIS